MNTLRCMAICSALIAASTHSQAQVDNAAKPETKGTFVTTVGTHKLFGGKITLKIEEVDGKLDSYVNRNREKGEFRKTGGWGPLNPRIKKGAPWFIYAESADEVWWFDGDSHLHLMPFENHRAGFADGGIYQIGRKQMQMVPREVQDRLPKAFKEGPKD
jgi:hypothetical protein